jgi:uncharacterized protein (DUF1800 family)
MRSSQIQSNRIQKNPVGRRCAASALLCLCLGLAFSAPQLLAKKKQKDVPESADNEQKRAVHALNRLAFGPRPGDVQAVMAMGVDRWIDLQLHPEKISDDAVEGRLAPFRTLRMSAHEMAEDFPDGGMVRQVADGKKPMPSDPAKRAVYQVQIAREEAKKAEKQAEAQKAEAAPQMASAEMPSAEMQSAPMASSAQSMSQQPMSEVSPDASSNSSSASGSAKTAEELAAAAAAMPQTEGPNENNATGANSPNTTRASNASAAETAPSKPSPEEEAEAKRLEDKLYADLEVQKLPDLPPDQRYKKVLAMTTDQQLAFADSLRGGKGQDFLAGLDPKQKETLLAMNNPQGVVSDELMQAKLLRAIYSQRQLEQVMTDFWFNHFNVFINKGADHVLVTSYEQDVIRPHALGKFEDLLVATAKSPAMLFYLDNWLSVGPNSVQALGLPAHPGPYGPYRFPRYPGPGPNPNAKRKQNAGLNENYGRELMELHTLSVNGGYSQRDVTEVAKVFTGWTIDKPNDGGGFQFDPRKHEPGPKFVLGHRIKPKGEEEGREVLHMLATSPQTAHFISLKLAERFVSDNPPPALVDRMAKTFQKKKGDIREVLATLFQSPEFWDETSYRAKMKTPLEFVASAVRATGADVDDAMPLARQLNNMGMPLYGAQPPTGYSMKAETWVSSSALLNRMNFALALTGGKIKGVKVDTSQLAGNTPGAPPLTEVATTLSTMEATLLAADVSKQTHDSIMAQVMPAPAAPQKPAMPAPPDMKAQPAQKTQTANPLQPVSAPQTANSGQKDNAAQRKPAPPRPPDANMIAGLLLGSPEFQRR